MKVFRNIVAVTALLALGTVMSGCEIYWPHDRGLHRGEYERDHDRGYHRGHDRGDHDRGRDHDREREHERDRDHRD